MNHKYNLDKPSKNPASLSRRTFLGTSLSAAAGWKLFGRDSFQRVSAAGNDENSRIKEYRMLGRTGFKVSDIGFGAGNLTVPEVLEAALDMGINYIDTAEHYVQGNSERSIGKVLKNRDRKKIFLTTKLNFFLGKADYEGLKNRFHKCLERLETEYVDCLMIHMTPAAEQLTHEPYHRLIKELKAEGRVRFTGLSNHGIEHSLAGRTRDAMEKVVLAAAEDGRFDVVLFVYNFLQKKQGENILGALQEKKMGATLMKSNPVKFYSDMNRELLKVKEAGRKIPEWYWKMLEEYKSKLEGAEEFKKKYGLRSEEEIRAAAIRFCLGHSGVHSICPTLNSFDDLEAYVALSGSRLTPKDSVMLSDYEKTGGRLYCRHACGECESSCPEGVPVNTILRYDHYFRAQGREKQAMEHYAGLKEGNASACMQCAGSCQKACPYELPVRSLLIQAHETLSLS